MRLTKNHFYVTAWALMFNFSCSQPSNKKAANTIDSLSDAAAVERWPGTKPNLLIEIDL